jgi:hypothetical protein
MQEEERRLMAAIVASGVVRIDSDRHTDPAGVARVSLAIVDEILTQTAPPDQDAAVDRQREDARMVQVTQE